MSERVPFGDRFVSAGGGDDSLEISLYETSKEREAYDEQANLYSIVLATEHLERAYARDAISQKEYVEQCKKLISQFRMAERVLRGTMSTETFMQVSTMVYGSRAFKERFSSLTIVSGM